MGSHQAFFLDNDEKTRAVELLRRVEEFVSPCAAARRGGVRRDQHGTMFEGRYHERNHKPEKPVMWRTAAYVDINAWKADLTIQGP